MSRDDLASQVLTLAQDLSRLQDQLREVTPRLDAVPGLAAAVERLSHQLAQSSGDKPDPPPSLWDWTTMSRQAAEDAWQELVEWVTDVLGGYYGVVGPGVKIGRGIPPCWYRHWDLVLELSWLCQDWKAVFQRDANNTYRAGEWHDRWLPGVLGRVADSSAGRCRAQHVDPPVPSRGVVDNADDLRRVIAADLAARPDDSATDGD